MNEEYVLISACCYSTKKDVSVGFGIGIEADTWSPENMDTDWIYEGLGESFWENYQEFEPGVAEARSIAFSEIEKDQEEYATFLNALHTVFGEFELVFEVNEKSVEFELDIDVNPAMFDMLQKL